VVGGERTEGRQEWGKGQQQQAEVRTHLLLHRLRWLLPLLLHLFHWCRRLRPPIPALLRPAIAVARSTPPTFLVECVLVHVCTRIDSDAIRIAHKPTCEGGGGAH
jgi:hypothetical protein